MSDDAALGVRCFVCGREELPRDEWAIEPFRHCRISVCAACWERTNERAPARVPANLIRAVNAEDEGLREYRFGKEAR